MMSKPATHVRTAAPSQSGGAANAPVTASHAPMGAQASPSPNTAWERAVTRLVNE